jgi:peptidoglycan-associated lipoprotein
MRQHQRRIFLGGQGRIQWGLLKCACLRATIAERGESGQSVWKIRRRKTLGRGTRLFIPILLVAALVTVSGCKKKSLPPLPPAATAPAAVAPAAPTAQITANPTEITAGGQVELTWKTTDASTVSIDGLGEVPSIGVKTVSPTQSTTYHMVAKGDGGTADASVRVTVNPAPPIVVAPSALSLEKEFKANVQDIFFDYDKYDLRGDAKAPLTQNAKYLLNHPNENILIGGYCDERGSNEYNLALGQRRADSAKKALVEDGVSATRIRVISYGKEKPFCTQSTEACWQENRRDGFSLDQK